MTAVKQGDTGVSSFWGGTFVPSGGGALTAVKQKQMCDFMVLDMVGA